jgi:hypothetical protein
MATITCKADALAAYHVSEEQISKVTLQQDCAIVKSATVKGVEYKVVYNKEHKVLQCLPYNSSHVCGASASGKGCWHKRATLAAIAINRLQAKERSARDAEIKEALASRTPQEIEEQRHIQEVIGQGVPSDEAFRVVTAKPQKGSGKGKPLNYDPSFSLLKK